MKRLCRIIKDVMLSLVLKISAINLYYFKPLEQREIKRGLNMIPLCMKDNIPIVPMRVTDKSESVALN